jgi:hypothetical protein
MFGKFYEQTVEWVFQESRLARGLMKMNGRTADPYHIKCPQFAVEGGKDDISPLGHTLAYLDMMGGDIEDKAHHVEENVGHYGAFNGGKFNKNIAPRIKQFIRNAGEKLGLKYSPVPKETVLCPPSCWDAECPPPREGTAGMVKNRQASFKVAELGLELFN